MSTRSVLTVEKQVNSASIGWWVNPLTGYSTPMGQLAPICKGREDVEVLMRNESRMNRGQPVEYSGWSLGSTLSRAMKVDNEVLYENGYSPFSLLSNHHPSLMSYPPEVLWLGNEKAINAFTKAIAQELPRAGMGYSREGALRLSQEIASMAMRSTQSMSFWNEIENEFDGETYARALIGFQVYSASRLRAKALAGMVPLIKPEYTSSLERTDTLNKLTAAETIAAREEGFPAPDFYFYAMNLDSSVFCTPNSRREYMRAAAVRDDTLRMANAALQKNTELYDGLHVRIRGIDGISSSVQRRAIINQYVDDLVRICARLKVPLWMSNTGLPGLSFLDRGVTYCSCQMGMNTYDIYRSGGGTGDPDDTYGKTYHPSKQKRLFKRDVEREAKNSGLPMVRGLGELRPEWLVSAGAFRTNFAKPYNLATICELSEQWQRYTRDGEDSPGCEYLARCVEDEEFKAWS